MIGMHYFRTGMSSSFSFTFINALITRCFAVECKVRPVLMYLRKPILATRWVSNVLKVTQVRRDWSVDMMLWSLYFIVDTVKVECISWCTKKRGNFIFLSVITSKYSVYSVPIGNSVGLVMTLSLMVIDAERSRSLIARNIFLCFTGRFTEVSDSELPNSTVIGVV